MKASSVPMTVKNRTFWAQKQQRPFTCYKTSGFFVRNPLLTVQNFGNPNTPLQKAVKTLQDVLSPPFSFCTFYLMNVNLEKMGKTGIIFKISPMKISLRASIISGRQ